MKLYSWNVNGLRACVSKGSFDAFLASADADALCLQETKLQAGQIALALPGYHQFWSYAEKKGYSGTAVFLRREPLSVQYGLGIARHDTEGRVITLELPDYYLVTVYTPNAQDGLRRLDYRMDWEDCFRAHLCALDARKPVVVCGDMNVAHQPIDLTHPEANRGNPGYSDEERGKFSALLDAGFLDSFRCLYPDRTEAYSWWSYRAQARARNVGWRIDYVLLSRRLRPALREAVICPEATGSDHCPVGVTLSC